MVKKMNKKAKLNRFLNKKYRILNNEYNKKI